MDHDPSDFVPIAASDAVLAWLDLQIRASADDGEGTTGAVLAKAWVVWGLTDEGYTGRQRAVHEQARLVLQGRLVGTAEMALDWDVEL